MVEGHCNHLVYQCNLFDSLSLYYCTVDAVRRERVKI